MSVEWLSAASSLLTVLIVGATALAALAQLRHLRAGNQITALLTIGDKFLEPRFVEARRVATAGLAKTLEDPTFRQYVVARSLRAPLPEISSDQLAVLTSANVYGNLFEEVGVLVKNGIVDEALFLDEYVTQVIGAWSTMESFVALIRDGSGDVGLWDNFEYLTVRARAFLEAHPTTYPKGVPRIPLKNPWALK
jgi:hypothetical protein